MRKNILWISFLFLHLHLNAQDYSKMGKAAMMRGKFPEAIQYLEKAQLKNPNDVNVLWMLGTSYYTDNEIFNSIETFDKLIKISPNDARALYFRAKAKQKLVSNTPNLSLDYKEEIYNSMIADFSLSISNSGSNFFEVLQSRGLAYKDYAVFKSSLMKKKIDKKPVIDLFMKSIADFNKIIELQSYRKDIKDLIIFNEAQIKTLR